ncbi:MMPL family transporter, partial [Vibrio cholerae O1]|nr:MMPL family transporter [Vibrio cholerae O1]
SSSFSIPGTEAQRAFDLLDERFPGGSADGATARVVFKAPGDEKVTSAANKAEIKGIVGDLKSGSDQIASVADPFAAEAVSEDG